MTNITHARDLLESAQSMHLTALLNAIKAGIPIVEAARQIVALGRVAA